MRLLLIEDEPSIAEFIVQRVSAAGFVVDRVGTAQEALAAIVIGCHALVLLDRRLPDTDGLSLVPALRQAQPGIPIIVLSALNAVPSRIEGLNAGADDYLIKPFAPDELVARIRAALRRPKGEALPVIHCGNLSFNPNDLGVAIDDRSIVLNRRELAMFQALMQRVERVVPRASLHDQVYGFDDEVQDNALDALVSRLRRYLAEEGATVKIHTIRGVGYMIRRDPS